MTQKNTLIAGNGHTIAAKNIRIELKAAYPCTKFSVTGKSFSGGNSIRISWMDGPASISPIIDKYEAGQFGRDEHGNEDIYTYAKGSHEYGSAKYITTSRELSDSFRTEIIEGVAKQYGDKDKPITEQWKSGFAYYVSPLSGENGGHWSWQSILYRTSVHSEPGHIVVSDY